MTDRLGTTIALNSHPASPDDLERHLLTHRSASLAGLGLPPDLVLPDYARSIANLPATLAAVLGADLPGALPALPKEWWESLAHDAKRVVLLILDAIGWLHLRHFLSREKGCIFQQLAEQGRLLPIGSIFPCTTTVALTSLWTGHSAAGHGMVGHDLFFPSLGMMVDTLGFMPAGEPRDERLVGNGIEPEELVPVPGMAELLAGQSIPTQVLIHRSFVGSGLSRLQFRGVNQVDGFVSTADLCVALRDRLAARPQGPELLVAYWAHMDTVGHLRGPESDHWRAELRNLAFSLERELLQELSPTSRSGTLLVVTADHGQIAASAEGVVCLERHPELAQALLIPPAGGPRAAYLQARPGVLPMMRDYMDRCLADRFAVVDSQAALAGGLWGPEPPSDEAALRVADVTLIGLGDAALDWKGRELPLAGLHGGLSRWEMLVPLLMARLD